MNFSRLGEYLIHGVLWSNPPGAPLIWFFFWDLIRPKRVGNRVLQGWVLLFVALYASTVSVRGMNHMRYALDSMFPLLTVLAPILMGWWDGRRRGWGVAMLIITLAAQLTFLGFWIGQTRDRASGILGLILVETGTLVQGYYETTNARQQDLELITSRSYEPRTLVLFAHHAMHKSPALTLSLGGRFDLVAITDFWPPSCEQAIKAKRARLRVEYRARCDIAMPVRDPGSNKVADAHFGSLTTFDQDRRWLADTERPESFQGWPQLEARAEALDTARDRARCIRDVEVMRAALSRYDQILVFMDAVSVRSSINKYNYGEMLEGALESLELLPSTLRAQSRWREVLRVPDPGDGEVRPFVWTLVWSM
jgi:hypothetical protein